MSEILDCEGVLAEVERFLDRELPAEEWHHIREHIEVCESCGNRVEFRRRLKEIIAAKCGGEAVPESLLARIRYEIWDEASD